jgi:hypothetical protein
MNVANIDFDDTLAVSVLHDLDMGTCSRNTVADIGKAPAVSLTGRTVGLPENLREQAGITGLSIGEQDQLMTIDQALGCIFQQAPNERLIALTLYV